MQTTELDCPLCMEPLEIDDVNFYPCTCGYQVCRFCWHRIRTDENGLCPACRKAYSEDPAVYTPLSQDEIQRIIKERKQKDTQRKQKLTENRKHLANVRVVQKNLVFVVGLTQRLADAELLKRPEYFGKFGKIHKIVINNSTNYAGPQGPSASAYITFSKEEDAHKAILTVGNAYLDGRTLKASLGTTKYCSYFLRNISCPKPDCMYLHDLGDEAASFTKEEMQEGKHQEYEQELLANYAQKMGVSTDKDTDDMWSGTPGSLPSGSNWDMNERDEETPYSSSPHRQTSTGYDESEQKHNENYWEDEIEENESQPPQPPPQINKTEERIDNEQTNNNTLQTQSKVHDKSRHVEEYTTHQGWTPSHGQPSNPLIDYQPAPGLFEAGPSDTFCSLGLSNLHLKVSSDDDLGFDPWNESSKGLADLLREEVSQTPSIPQPGMFTGIPTRPGSFVPQLQQHYSANTKDDFKSWQEGFRALLPNININFAGWSSSPEGQHQTPSEWSPATQTVVPTETHSQAVRPPPGFESRKPEPQIAAIDDPSIVWSKAIGSKSDSLPIIPGIIPNGFSNLSSNNTDLPGAVTVQSPGMLNNTVSPSVKQFLALFDTTTNDGDYVESERKPQSLHSQWDLQTGYNKKQSYRKTTTNYQGKDSGRIMSKEKHVMVKPRDTLKQPESNKCKITGRLA